MNITLFGGTGFVGSHLARSLTHRGHNLTLFTRRPTPDSSDYEQITGQLDDINKIDLALNRADVLIYCIGIIRAFSRRGITFERAHVSLLADILARAAVKNVRHVILISAWGIDRARTPYQRTKLEGESILKSYDIPWTILRPSLIFGPANGRKELTMTLARQMIKPRIPVPLFFSGWQITRAGQFRLSPVHVSDVAELVGHVIDRLEEFSRQTLPVGGPDSLTWREMVTRIAAACGRKKWFVPVPVALLFPVLALLDRFAWFPITRDQLTMLVAGNDCAEETPWTEWGINPKRFTASQLSWLK